MLGWECSVCSSQVSERRRMAMKCMCTHTVLWVMQGVDDFSLCLYASAMDLNGRKPLRLTRSCSRRSSWCEGIGADAVVVMSGCLAKGAIQTHSRRQAGSWEAVNIMTSFWLDCEKWCKHTEHYYYAKHSLLWFADLWSLLAAEWEPMITVHRLWNLMYAHMCRRK